MPTILVALGLAIAAATNTAVPNDSHSTPASTSTYVRADGSKVVCNCESLSNLNRYIDPADIATNGHATTGSN